MIQLLFLNYTSTLNNFVIPGKKNLALKGWSANHAEKQKSTQESCGKREITILIN